VFTLTKKRFINYITTLKLIESDLHKVHIAFKKLDPDFGGFYLSRFSTLIIKVLQDAMQDKYDYINYFIYELDYGKKWKKGMITRKNGEDVKLKTPEDLYNYLIETKNEK